jgi:hypothetical protein
VRVITAMTSRRMAADVVAGRSFAIAVMKAMVGAYS